MASNTVQNIATYQMSGLALLQNMYCYINKANTKFKDFDRIVNNLGATVTFDKPPRFVTNSSLVATFQDSTQLTHSLTVDQAENVAYEFTAQEYIFNVDDYMDRFGRSAIAELGAAVEANVALNNISHTFRFYGDGTTAIDSYTQLSRALAFYRSFGAASRDTRGILPLIDVPAIIGSGLSEFAPRRNDDIAYSWMIGDYDNTEWYRSNLIPIHYAGAAGNDAITLTVVSINAAGDQITVSGAGDTADVMRLGDLLQFSDGVTGYTNLRYLTWVGHQVSSAPVQMRSTNASQSVADSMIVSIYPSLNSTVGSADQNINTPVVAGMQLTVLPDHRAGLIYGGDSLFLAMPRLPEEVPFPTANKVDPDTGVSMRMYAGSQFGLNQRGTVNDCIWGSTLVDEYAMRLVFPL